MAGNAQIVMAGSNKVDITIMIPTYNGEEYLEGILKAVFKQDIDRKFEVLIIDSGSSDNTLSIIAKFPKVRLHTIPNSEFGHGKTRMLGARMAKGEYVVYLTHDAVPSHDRWLYEILKPFELNEKIVAVIGKQIPRKWCIPMLKHEINGVFKGLGSDVGTTVFYKDTFMKNEGLRNATGFYSDVNSATKKSFLLEEIGYRDVDYAEDQLFGRDVIDAGWYKAYASRASVLHSNELSLGEYKKRIFDETVGLRKIGYNLEPPKRRLIIKSLAGGVVRDTLRILKDDGYTPLRKVYWLFVNPLFHVEKWRGARAATRINLKDKNAIAQQSLEAHKRGD